jgi:hypothetical protein
MWSSLEIVVRKATRHAVAAKGRGIGIFSLTFTTPQKMDMLSAKPVCRREHL